jgi:hypothetical protein
MFPPEPLLVEAGAGEVTGRMTGAMPSISVYADRDFAAETVNRGFGDMGKADTCVSKVRKQMRGHQSATHVGGGDSWGSDEGCFWELESLHESVLKRFGRLA